MEKSAEAQPETESMTPESSLPAEKAKGSLGDKKLTRNALTLPSSRHLSSFNECEDDPSGVGGDGGVDGETRARAKARARARARTRARARARARARTREGEEQRRGKV
uniref:R domain-containing protein n=1 Tax=Vespula pensylvanica TaxID=30213 RepID=A0A834U9V7_VESPE|nr:hypothetical protein H0235_007475 [Vespula pensylvanica]